MAYRGEDLDLRTPQTWSGSSSSETTGGSQSYLNGSRGSRGASPILVDDTVLACSNHAFDVAVAHRAGEVRLEHLLHAMTRIDNASNALESRGVRVAGLRRESATIIASEIPIGLSAGQGRPRRSDDFETVLRTASSIAYRRNGPANVDDVLDALLDMPTDVPAIALLARHGGRLVRDRVRGREPAREPARDIFREREAGREPVRDVAREREPMRERELAREPMQLQPLPPLTRPASGYVSDVRMPDNSDTLRDRSPKSTGAYYGSEIARPVRTDHLIGTATDGIQNARIDQLETAVRTLTSELSSERNIVAGVVQDLQRNLNAEREDTTHFRGGLHDRLKSLEQTVLSVSNDDSRAQMHNQLHDRMKSLEYSVLNSRKDDNGADAAMLLDRLASVERGLEQRVNELARPWSVLTDRLQAMEQALQDTRGPDLSGLYDRLAGLERTIRDTAVDGNRSAGGLADRLKLMERSLDVVSSKSIDLTPIANRLDIIEEAVLSQDSAQSADKLGERLRSLEAALQAQSTDVKALSSALAAQAANTERTHSFVADRMQTLASGLERQRSEVTGPLNERLNSLAATLDARTQSVLAPLVERLSSVADTLDGRTEAAVAPLVERVNALTATLENRTQTAMAPLIDRMGALSATLDSKTATAMTPLVDRMNGLAVAIDGRASESQRMAQVVNERLNALETRLAESIQRTTEAQTAHASELREVHEALIKLNTNQHTLAGSIDQWRLDGVGDISVISKQLDTIEKTAAQPTQMIEHLTTSVDNINKATVERYHRRNRFWYWLFGTDDWLTASWPSQVAGIEAERTALRGSTIASAKPVQRA